MCLVESMAGWDSLEEGDQRSRRELAENVARRGIVSGVEWTTSAACVVDGPGVPNYSVPSHSVSFIALFWKF